MLQKYYIGTRLTWTGQNELVEGIEKSRPVVGGRSSRISTGTYTPTPMSRGAGGGISPALFVFGYSPSGAVVTTSKGYCQHSTRGTLTSPETDVTITADHQFIVVNYVIGAAGVTLSTSGTYPLPDATTWRKPLHQWRLIGGGA